LLLTMQPQSELTCCVATVHSHETLKWDVTLETRRYEAALALAPELKPSHPTILTLAVSYSFFLYEVMGHHEEACRFASAAFHAAKGSLESAPKAAVEAAHDGLQVRYSVSCCRLVQSTNVGNATATL